MIELFLGLNTEDLNNFEPAQLIGFSDDIEKVIEEGRRQLSQVVAAHTRLTNTTAKDGTAFVMLRWYAQAIISDSMAALVHRYFGSGRIPTLPKSSRSASQHVCTVMSPTVFPPV